LRTLGAANLVLSLLAVVAAVALWRFTRRRGLRRAPTWDCGYALPTARMQYTAGSFAGIIVDWFAWILRPQRHEHRPEGVFPLTATSEEHTPEVVLEQVIAPAGSLVMRFALAARRLQHGRIQAYLLYVIAGLVAIAALVLVGAMP
jgi:hydrogenase-4 component B